MLAAGIGCGVLLWGVHQERLGTQTGGEVWFHANGRTEVEIEAAVVRMRDRSAFLPRGVLRVTKNKGNPKPLRGCLIAVDKLPDGAIPGDQLLLKGRTFFPAAPRRGGPRDSGSPAYPAVQTQCVSDRGREEKSLCAYVSKCRGE